VSVSTSSIDSVRDAVEAFVRDANREFYLHGSGQKETLEIAAIVDKYGPAFTP
jgi:hypothetical protein